MIPSFYLREKGSILSFFPYKDWKVSVLLKLLGILPLTSFDPSFISPCLIILSSLLIIVISIHKAFIWHKIFIPFIECKTEEMDKMDKMTVFLPLEEQYIFFNSDFSRGNVGMLKRTVILCVVIYFFN